MGHVLLQAGAVSDRGRELPGFPEAGWISCMRGAGETCRSFVPMAA